MAYNAFSIEGKCILVTGASSGIGRATAIECAKAGAHLFLTGRNIERLRQTINQMDGDGHVFVQADLTSATDIDTLVANLDGQLDGVVLCSGINDKALVKHSKEEFMHKMMNTNFIGPSELLQKLLKSKKIKRGASIVILSSISSFFPSISNALYGASKAALKQFAKVLALELMPQDIRVNCIEPAFVETSMIEKYVIQDEFQKIKENYLSKRFTKPEEIAFSVIYLLSDATCQITGTSIIIDGGFTIKR